VIVEPTWERLKLAYATVVFNGDVLLLGSSRRSWDGRQEVEQDKGLGERSVVSHWALFCLEARVGAL
jgi:hypothetical protein